VTHITPDSSAWFLARILSFAAISDFIQNAFLGCDQNPISEIFPLMRHSSLLLSGLLGLGLTACVDTQSSTASNPDNSGSFAMRVPAAVVTAGTGIVDSVTLRVVPLNAPASAIVKSWPLKEEELLFESLPSTRCSVYVSLPKKDKSGIAYTGAAVVDVRPGRTTQADINLTQTTGSLSLNIKIDAYNTTTAAPKVAPASGVYLNSTLVTLTHPVTGTVMQYRLENATVGSTAAWSTYTAAFTIAQSSVLYVRAINGTDTGAIQTSNYFINYGKVLNNFETAYGTTIGWNGTVYKGSTTALASVTGSRLTAGAWGTTSARLAFVLDGANYTGYAGATFNSTGIDWTRLKAIRIKLRSNIARTVTVRILATQADYAAASAQGGSYGMDLRVTPTSNEFTINSVDLATPAWYMPPANFPALNTVLPTVTGIGVETGCTSYTATGACTNQAGSLEIDDIIVDQN
jgi:hypothetical protein